MLEIERKFKVKNKNFKSEAYTSQRITQAYLNSNPARSVRIRIKGDQAFITIKGLPDQEGTTRLEWEKEISIMEAETLLPLCEPGSIDKTRYFIEANELVYEVDEFYGANEGLVIAEIELTHADQPFFKPSWLGEEVTGQNKYYNSQLITQPYNSWEL